ncbi:MAG TPA: threonylcarbamoyl-AMP synthase [Candidatus Portnoybacteria bacterium]|nr:threonylcarbamoyl-AMP synthase [Candidatus Portnoybacteria bacterium]
MKKIKVYPNDLRKTKPVIDKAAKVLWDGGVIVIPTDTVYGLLADATQEKAVEKIYQIKNRAQNKPLPLFCSDLKMAKKVAIISPKVEKKLTQIWPGVITVVLPNRRKLSAIVTADLPIIALRVPNYKLVNYLLEIYSRPLVATSANISGQQASTEIKEVLEQFNQASKKPDLILNAGNLVNNSPSTIIDLVHQKSRFLRIGPIKKGDLDKILGE